MSQEIVKRAPASTAMERISSHAKLLNRQRAALVELSAPNTITGRARALAARFIPGLERFQQTPMEEVRASLRGNLIDLYQDMGELLTEGQDRVQFHNSLDNLLKQVEKDPNNIELEALLREKLRARVEDALSLRRNEETEALLAEVLEQQDRQQQRETRDRLVQEAKQLLHLSGPTIKAIQTSLVGAAQMFDSLTATYATALELGPAMDLLHKSSGNLIRASKLNVTSFNTMYGQIDLALKASQLAAEATELGRELDRTVNPERLQELKARSEQLVLASQISRQLEPPKNF